MEWRQLGAAASEARGSLGWRDSDVQRRRDGGGIEAGEGDGTVVGEGGRTTVDAGRGSGGRGGRCSSGAEDSDGRGWGHLVLDQVEALCLAANDHCLNGTTVARRRQPPSQHGQCSPRSGCAAPSMLATVCFVLRAMSVRERERGVRGEERDERDLTGAPY